MVSCRRSLTWQQAYGALGWAFRVVEALEYSYKIEHLLTSDVVDAHGSRLKSYDDASMDVADEIVQHVSKQGIVMAVEEIKGHRYNEATSQWELLISSRGLQGIGDSWGALHDLQRDIPRLIERSRTVTSKLNSMPSVAIHFE